MPVLNLERFQVEVSVSGRSLMAEKKGFICFARHPNVASYRLCAWLSFPGVERPERHAFIRLHRVLKMKLWRCSSARSPRTALPLLTCFQKPYISILLLLGEGSRMMNCRQPAACTICFALRESTGLLQNV